MAEENIRRFQENKEPSQDYVEKIAKPLQEPIGLKTPSLFRWGLGYLQYSRGVGSRVVGGL